MGTATFFKYITNMWHTKYPDTGYCLFDADRYPINNLEDRRLIFLEQMATSFKLMNVLPLTQAMRTTLLGIISITKVLLEKGFEYMLPGQF